MPDDLPVLQTALSDGGPTKRARRPALSCVECRLRKVKCDRNKPCGACIRTKSDKCTYRPLRTGFRTIDPPHSRTRVEVPPADGNPSRPSQSPHLPAESDCMPNPHVAPAISGAHGAVQITSRLDRPVFDVSSDKTRDCIIASLRSRVNELEAKLGNESTLPVGTNSTSPPSPTPGTFVKSRYFGQSHWANAIEPVSRPAACSLV
jgi:hypothetical protein